MRILNPILILTLIPLLAGALTMLANPLQAGPDHAHEHQEDNHATPQGHGEAAGMHGGKLLQQGAVALELLLHEAGGATEYRAWVTRNDQPVASKHMALTVTLTRLGGLSNRLKFTRRGEYWHSNDHVDEPHSFAVAVDLRVEGDQYQWTWEAYQDRTHIEPEIARGAGIGVAEAGPGRVRKRVTTYGKLSTSSDQLARVHARFPGVASGVSAQLGQRVSKGDVMAEVESNESLKRYSVRAPISGVVVARTINNGELAGEQALFTIANLDYLWAELKVFPNQRGAVRAGQEVALTSSALSWQGTIDHLLPGSDDSPYALARIRIENQDGQLSPGQLVQGDIVIEDATVPLVVDNRALQRVGDGTVVFLEAGDNYEPRLLELGRSDGQVTEVLQGLRSGERYVVENSYLIKADIEKSGASHDH